MAQNATRQQAVIDALKAEGIEARDIQTSGLNLSPRMVFAEGQPPKLSGYTAQNMVTVRVRDLARLGPVLDKLVETGANEINGIGFAREDMEAARDEARARRQATIPTRSYGKADDFGAACAFLCSQQARFIVGQNLLLDGGALNVTI